MNCRDVQSLEGNFLDGELPEEMCDRVRHHLLRCHACRGELDSLRMAVEVLQQTHAQAVPGEHFLQSALETLARELALPTREADAPGQLVLVRMEQGGE